MLTASLDPQLQLERILAVNEALWEHVRRVLAMVDQANPRTSHEVAMRLLKIGEEAGEVAAAYIGATGQNPRKGVTHDLDDVIGECFDTAVTALVAASTLAGDTAAARAALDAHLVRRGPRLAALLQQPERTTA
jgi:hypothetical protein